MRKLLKRIIPVILIEIVHRYGLNKQLRKYTASDAKRFFRHSNIFYQDTQSKKIGKIILSYHVLEKGLTMPDMKLGFGKGLIMRLVDDCLDYYRKFDKDNTQFIHAVSVIAEYKLVHEENNFKLDTDLEGRIESLLDQVKIRQNSEQIRATKDSYFAFHNAPFNEFSASRRSVRNFHGSIEVERIYKAIDLAQNTPSSCNRQSSRMHIIEERRIIEQIFEVQNGNRGFGHLVNKLILLTVDLSVYQGAKERNLAFIDGGMYSMNLLYALHFNKIATCCLNLSVIPQDDLKLRHLVSIPDSEEIVLLIACGDVPEDFKLANSKRNSYKDVIENH